MTRKPNLAQRLAIWLARVTAVDVGKADDGLISVERSGGSLDRTWDELSGQFTDALEAWRKNPLAKRTIGIITAYAIGDGITLTSTYGPLKKYLATWWSDPQNMMDLRLQNWSDELARAGEIFVTLHLNPVDGISYVRPMPASVIDKITWLPGDYETEIAFHEVVGYEDPDYSNGGRTWYGPAAPGIDEPGPDGRYKPMMLHFAVNRPVGCVRGDSDLATILPWLKRYARWLEDRVRLNAAVRAFLWIVKVPRQQIQLRREELRTPPEAGTVQVIDKDAETWEAVAPSLGAGDVAMDGRAIRWMVAAGGPGIALTDFGESETANLASATAMQDQRTRFLKARQAYFGYLLARLGLESYNRAVRLGLWKGAEKGLTDIMLGYSDVSTDDNQALASASASIAGALKTLTELGVQGEAFTRLALRLVLKFAGEQVGEQDIDALMVDNPEPKPAPKEPPKEQPAKQAQDDAAEMLAAVAYEYAAAADLLRDAVHGGNGHGATAEA